MPEIFAEALKGLHWTELLAVVFGLVYVVLAARGNVWCWFWGILSCGLWAWAAFKLYDLYIDALLQLFYVVFSFYGIWQWKHGGEKSTSLKISRLTAREHIFWIGLGIGITLPVGYYFDRYTQAAATYPDAFTTIFSILVTYLVAQKKLENWLYWVVIDVVYVYLYGSRGSWLFTLLFVLYTFIAILCYFKWKKQMELETAS